MFLFTNEDSERPLNGKLLHMDQLFHSLHTTSAKIKSHLTIKFRYLLKQICASPEFLYFLSFYIICIIMPETIGIAV